MALVVSDEGSGGGSSIVGSLTDGSEAGEAPIVLLNADVTVGMKRIEDQLTVLQRAPLSRAEDELGRTQAVLGETKELYDMMKNEIRQMPQQDRSLWLPQVKKHQERLKQLIVEVSGAKQSLEQRIADAQANPQAIEVEDEGSEEDLPAISQGTNSTRHRQSTEYGSDELPPIVEDGENDEDEPVTISDHSLQSEEGPSSQDVNMFEGVNNHLQALNQSLQVTESSLARGVADSTAQHELVEAQNHYDALKELVRSLPPEARAEATPVARDARDRLHKVMVEFRKLKTSEQAEAEAAAVPGITGATTAAAAVSTSPALIEQENEQLLGLLNRARANLNQGNLPAAEVEIAKAGDVYEKLKEDVRSSSPEVRASWLPEVRNRREELLACMAAGKERKTAAAAPVQSIPVVAAAAAVPQELEPAISEKQQSIDELPVIEDAGVSDTSIGEVTDSDVGADTMSQSTSMPASQRTEEMMMASMVASLETEIQTMTAKLNAAAAKPAMSQAELQDLKSDVETVKGNYDVLKDEVRALPPEERQEWLGAAKGFQTDLKIALQKFSDIVRINQARGTQEDVSAAPPASLAEMEALHATVETAKANASQALGSTDPAGGVAVVERDLADIAKKYEHAKAAVVALPDSERQAYVRELEVCRSDFKSLQGQLAHLKEEAKAASAMAAVENDLVHEASSTDQMQSTGDQEDLISSPPASKQDVFEAATAMSVSVEQALEVVDRDIEKASVALSEERYEATRDHLTKARSLYDEYKEAVRSLPADGREQHVAQARKFQERIKTNMELMEGLEERFQEKSGKAESRADTGGAAESVEDSVADSSVASMADSDTEKKPKFSCCACS